jgi:ribosomal protein S6--L-glutamate ligase
MNIAVISRNPELYANRRLHTAARERGASVTVIDPLASHEADFLEAFDAVLPRFGPVWQRQGGHLLARMQALGVVCLNSAESMALARNKPAAMAVYRQRGLPFPESISPQAPLDAKALMRLPFGFPMLIKQDASAGGWGVHRVDDLASAMALMAALELQGEAYTLQAFIAEVAGRDVRAFVCNGRVIGAMQRIAPPGEFRANMHLGARAEALILHEDETALVLAATACLGLAVAGVDLLRTAAGPLLLEVNAAPGFEALEAATGCDIAGEMLDLLISRTNGQNVTVNNQIIR